MMWAQRVGGFGISTLRNCDSAQLRVFIGFTLLTAVAVVVAVALSQEAEVVGEVAVMTAGTVFLKICACAESALGRVRIPNGQ
jgi:NhaP-type Na+/H+ or K+/H+ antiporter